MVGQTYEEKMRLVWESIGSKKVEKDIQSVTTKAGQLDNRVSSKKVNNLANRLGVTPDSLGQMRTFSQETEVQKQLFKESAQEAKRFKGEYLGVLFAGMSLQRAFGGLLKTLITDYKELSGEAVNPLTESLTRLEANFKFLKFSIVEAAGPLIIQFSDFLSETARSIAKMDAKKLKGVFLSIASLAAIGGIMNVFGQGAIFFSSLTSAKASKSVINALSDMKGLPSKNTFSEGSNFLTTLGGLGSIAFGVKDVFEGLDAAQAGDMFDALFETLSGGLKIAGGGRFLKSKGAKGGWLIGLGFALDLANTPSGIEDAGVLLGTIAGLFTGLTTVVSKGIAEVRETMRRAIGDNGFLNLLFFGAGGTEFMREKDAELSALSWGEAFADGFDKGFTPTVGGFEIIQDKLNKLRDESEASLTNEVNPLPQQIAETFNPLLDTQSNPKEAALFKTITETLNPMQTLQEKWLKTNNTLSTLLPQSTQDWMNDKEKGLEGVQNRVDNINMELSKPITKTVTIKEIRKSVNKDDKDRSSSRFNSIINTGSVL